MIDMSSWREETVDVVNEIRLDPENVRLDRATDSPEVDIIQDLFQNEKALELVENIVKAGYFTHERPIALERSGELLVVEGNRRVAALKAIQNPYLVPAFHRQVENLVKLLPNRDALKFITVMIAPSQEEANQLIAALHTGAQRVSWSRVRQAAFFDAQLEAGISLGELIEHYPTIDVRDFARRSSLLRLFRGVDYRDPELSKYIHTSKFPLTVLERIYGNGEFQQIAGITIDPTTTRASVSDPRRFRLLAEKIIGDMYYKRVNTRRLNSTKSADFIGYIEELKALGLSDLDAQADFGEAGADGSPESDQDGDRGAPDRAGNHADGTDTSKGADSGARPTPRPKTPYLNVAGLTPWPQYPELATVFGEVGRINFRNLPNASHDLLRTVLEKTIKAYADIRKVSIPRRGPYVQLKDCLDWLVKDFSSRPECKSVVVPARVLKDGTTGNYHRYTASQDYLNAINHNFLSVALPEHVEGAWSQMRPVIKFMFEDTL